MNRPTQKDVARLAGVSRATVSYVINERSGGKVQITEETRRRVLEAIEELGYQPNVTARSLRTQQTHLVGLMVPDLTNPFYPFLIRGAQPVAHQHDYQILVYDCNDKAAYEHTFVDTMLQRRVDGIIMVPFHLEETDVARLTQAGIQVVVVGGRPRLPEIDNLWAEEHQAIVELMGHLISKGHRRIAHLAGPQDTPPGRKRFRAYRDALAQAGIPYDETLVRFGEFHREGVKELILSLFPSREDSNRPTALFAANDIMAIEAIRVLIRQGWRVPEDVAVCGFDNIPEAGMVMSALTTIDQFPQTLGQRAAELLMERLGNSEPIVAREVTTPCRLVIRESA